jgi:hypothetical protein
MPICASALNPFANVESDCLSPKDGARMMRVMGKIAHLEDENSTALRTAQLRHAIASPGNSTPAMTEVQASQRRGLISTTTLLEEHTRAASQSLEPSYASATIICAHVAAECILNEWAARREPAVHLRMASEGWPLVRAIEELLPRIDGSLPANTVYMANVRNWLCSPGPEYYRIDLVATWLTVEGAQRALAVVLSLESQFFPGGQPAVASA